MLSLRWRVATGRITDACCPRHGHQKFLKQVAKALPASEVADRVRQLRHSFAPGGAGQAGTQPTDHMNFIPTSGSWPNLVEIFFVIITPQAIHRGSFTSVKDLIAAIEASIDGWSCGSLGWTKQPTDPRWMRPAVKDHRSRHNSVLPPRCLELEFRLPRFGAGPWVGPWSRTGSSPRSDDDIDMEELALALADLRKALSAPNTDTQGDAK